jgi:hypothetical protein
MLLSAVSVLVVALPSSEINYPELRGNLSHCHFVHHKPAIEPGLLRWEAGD